MNDKYILNEQGEPVPEPDLMKWGSWLQSEPEKRRVASDHIGDVHVSTVFLGLDHAWNNEAPLLWETMVFGGAMNDEQDRCSGTRADALAMHAKMMARVRSTEEQVVS